MRTVSLLFLLTFSFPSSHGVELVSPPPSLVPASFLPSHFKETPPPEVVPMRVTAYCPCALCCDVERGVTALGDDAWTLDGVAADFIILPERSVLLIPGVGAREVDDTGGEMRRAGLLGRYHIDVRFRTHEEALAFGSQILPVTILAP